jgi:hypothetical protein
MGKTVRFYYRWFRLFNVFRRFNILNRHAREGGHLRFVAKETEIPAFAGMTVVRKA